MLSSENLTVLRNIIGGVESGGQIYGRRNYADYAGPYTNSPGEHTITLGWAQCYGYEAMELIRRIFAVDPDEARRLDTCSPPISGMLNCDWVAEKWNPTAEQKAVLIALITSEAGKAAQDALFDAQMAAYIKEAETYTLDPKAVMLWCEIRHLGGKNAAARVFDLCAGDYSTARIRAALREDARGYSNRVGSARYASRHDKCVEWIEKYAEVGSMISNSGHDENGRYSGGQAGDQTGGEWSIQPWYNRPWSCVLRHPVAEVREAIARNAEKAARNDLIGYNQDDRLSYYEHLKASDWDPSQVTVPCAADCSAGVTANVIAAGHQTGRGELAALDPDTYTGNMRQRFRAAGFSVLTDDKYLTSPDFLKRGDILLYDGHHTATNLTDGERSGSSGGGEIMFSVETVKRGSKGDSARLMQMLLRAREYVGADGKQLSLDGHIGDNSIFALLQFQRRQGLATDAICGPATWAKLLGLPVSG